MINLRTFKIYTQVKKRMSQFRRKDSPSTSWESVGKWYDSVVGEHGHYYHQHVVIPGVMKLLDFNSQSNRSALLDLACGQGILGRHLPQTVTYVGIDLAPSLIKSAQKYDIHPHHSYYVSDITQPLPNFNQKFTHSTIILALQNIEFPDKVFKEAAKQLADNAQLIIVLNHPYYRIARQSSWEIDEANKMQYRRVNRYMSPLKIPIKAHPSQGEASAASWSFHYPLSSYSKWLKEAGFSIELIEEWVSNKVSTGKAAKMENRSREEFPLFLTIAARKK